MLLMLSKIRGELPCAPWWTNTRNVTAAGLMRLPVTGALEIPVELAVCTAGRVTYYCPNKVGSAGVCRQ